MMNIDNIIASLLAQELGVIPTFAEIENLEGMLQKAGIPFEKEPLYGGVHLGYPSLGEECTCSVILHDGSYGHKEGLLEIKGLLTPDELEYDEVVGFLTADDVFERIKKDWESHQDS